MSTTIATSLSRVTPPAMRHAARMLAILRWLGPWADPKQMPRVRAELTSDPIRHVRMAIAAPKGVRPVVLLLPGLHFLGPDDPRFRRFAAVLAATGVEVIAPYLSDFLGLRLTPRLHDEARAALSYASERAQGPVSVMSISFGSIAALHLAASQPDVVKRLVIFGGYRDLERSFRFALGAAVEGFPAEVRDPLNGPAVLANLTEELLPEHAQDAFRAAALAFSRRTWSRSAAAEDKRDGRHLRVGRELADTLTGEARALFRIACRLEGAPLDLVDEAFSRARGRFAFLDPGPLLAQVQAPVTCVHGRDDDVIPWTEAPALARDLPNARAIVTGLYGHTGRASAGAAGIGAIAGELSALAQLTDALATLGSER